MVPAYTDVRQGGLGDCGFVATCAEIAWRRPDIIENMFIDNGDGTYTVRFYKHNNDGTYQPIYTTLDGQLPYGYASTYNGLWVGFAERAWAQIYESFYGTDTYNGIAGTWIFDAIEKITGMPIMAINSTSAANVQQIITNAFNAGKLIGFASVYTGTTDGIIGNHAYAMIGYDSQTITLYNPWGYLSTITWQSMMTNFTYYDRQQITSSTERGGIFVIG